MDYSNPIKRYAVIINGDTEDHHIKNVEISAEALRKEGYEIFVASSRQPHASINHFYQASSNKVEKLFEELKKKIDTNDELVIYTTGHGNTEGLCLSDVCQKDQLANLINGLDYGQRTIIMDQCYGGDWNKLFLKSPKTLFISAGSQSESTCCQEMAPWFWSQKIDDYNHDGKISWQERYSYALSHGQRLSNPQFLPTLGYIQKGKASFSSSVKEVTGKKFQKALNSLQEGQYAIVTFSASWCKPCHEYRPFFNKIARESHGQFLFLRTDDEDLAREWGVSEYPTVMVIDKKYTPYKVSDRYNVINEISNIHLSPDALFERLILEAEKTVDPSKRARNLYAIGDNNLMNFNDKAKLAYEKALLAVEQIQDPNERVSGFHAIALAFIDTGHVDRAKEVFEMAVSSIGTISMPENQFLRLMAIVNALVNNGFQKRAMELLDTLVEMTDKLPNNILRFHALISCTKLAADAGFADKASKIFRKIITETEGLDPSGKKFISTEIIQRKYLTIFALIYADFKKEARYIYQHWFSALPLETIINHTYLILKEPPPFLLFRSDDLGKKEFRNSLISSTVNNLDKINQKTSFLADIMPKIGTLRLNLGWAPVFGGVSLGNVSGTPDYNDNAQVKGYDIDLGFVHDLNKYFSLGIAANFSGRAMQAGVISSVLNKNTWGIGPIVEFNAIPRLLQLSAGFYMGQSYIDSGSHTPDGIRGGGTVYGTAYGEKTLKHNILDEDKVSLGLGLGFKLCAGIPELIQSTYFAMGVDVCYKLNYSLHNLSLGNLDDHSPTDRKMLASTTDHAFVVGFTYRFGKKASFEQARDIPK